MGKTSLHHFLSLAELFGFLLLDAILASIRIIFLTFSTSFLVCNPSTREMKLINIEDAEMIMERMGMSAEPNECLDSGELSALIEAMFEESEPSLEEVKEAFSVFDENRDGFIDAGELLRVLEKLGIGPGVELAACRSMIADHDVNQDGRIDFSEFVRFLETSF